MPCEGLFSFAYHIMSANLGGFQTPAIVNRIYDVLLCVCIFMIIVLSQVSLLYCFEVAPPFSGSIL